MKLKCKQILIASGLTSAISLSTIIAPIHSINRLNKDQTIKQSRNNGEVNTSVVHFQAGTDKSSDQKITKDGIQISTNSVGAFSSKPYKFIFNSSATFSITDTDKISGIYQIVTEQSGASKPIFTSENKTTIRWDSNKFTQQTSISNIYVYYYQKFSVSASAQTGGTATVSLSKVIEGETCKFTATPSTGYKFTGWYNGSTKVSDSSTYEPTVNSELSLTAHFEANSYSITYYDQGGTACTAENKSSFPTTHTYGTSKTLVNGIKTKHIFKGWFTKSDCTGSSITEISATSASATVLYAKWAEAVTITFNMKGHGTEIGSKNIEKGTAAVKPTDPTATGYTFEGWYEDEACTNIWDFSKTISNDKNLYAKWTPITYNITYELNGGAEPTTPNPSTYTIETDDIELQAPTKTGYDFVGWYDAQTGGNPVTKIPKGSFGNKTYYARWTAQKYDIIYKDQGGNDFSGTHASEHPTTHTYDTETTLKTATKIGYTFGGWYTNSECTGEPIATLRAKDYTGNITLYAKWTANTYNITYKDQGGADYSGDNKESLKTEHTYDTETELVSGEKRGYKFKGWFDNSACTGTQITKIGKTQYANNFTLYAKWEVNTYNITYKDQGDKDYTGDNKTSLIQTHTYDNTTTLVNGEKRGYTFKGWYKDKDCTEGQEVASIGPKDIIEDLTLYAKWEVNTYDISYRDQDDKDYSGENKEQLVYNHTYDTPTELVNGVKTGYTFNGWYKSQDCSDTPITSIGPKEIIENLTLYAKWTANKYKIIYKDQGGKPFSGTHDAGYPTIHTYDNKTELKGATRTGCYFGGWYTNPECTGDPIESITEKQITGTITLYAKWIGIEYNITYKDQGGVDYSGDNKDSLISTHTYGTPTQLVPGYRKGYTFLGWYDNPECTGSSITSISAEMYIDHVTLYAKWTKSSYSVTFKMNGHGSQVERLSITTDGKIVKPKDPESDGFYKFEGWYKDAAYKQQWDFEKDTVKDNTVLYAKWTKTNKSSVVVASSVGGTVAAAGIASAITIPKIRKVRKIKSKK